MGGLLAEVVGYRREVIVRPAESTLRDRPVPRHVIVAAIWQSWIRRRPDAERLVLGRGHRAVVLDDEVPVPAPEEADVQRHPRQDLLLYAGRELPVVVPLAPSLEQIGIELGVRRR